MEKQTLKFPEGFFWGAATSAHQVEGGTHNDWSEWEKENAERLAEEAKGKWADWQKEKFPEMFEPENYLSGKACDHYNLYEKDFDAAKELGHSAHRFSIEWSRIEPEEGKFDEKEIEHYRKVIRAIRERGMEPFVTLWHFTNPVWVNEIGGWENKKTIEYFLRYTEKIIEAFQGEVKFWASFNEAPTYAGHVFALGEWLDAKRNIFLTNRVLKNICGAHNRAYSAVKAKYGDKIKFGIVYNLKHHTAYNSRNILDRIVAKIDEYFRDTRYLEMTTGRTDFIGLNYYFHDRLRFSIGGRFFGLAEIKNPNEEITDLGWDVSPEGIYGIITRLKKYNLPIYITENGLADALDEKRAEFIKNHLFWVHKAISEGADVRGYFYWSLLDNFEWDKGFWPRFGLIEVDPETQARTVRKSALEYAKICKNNEIEV